MLVGIPNKGDRAMILAAIERLGVQHCGYAWGETPWLEHTCDCKYGGPGMASFNAAAGKVVPYTGEKTGCPELRTLHHVVSLLTDAQWDELCGTTVTRLADLP